MQPKYSGDKLTLGKICQNTGKQGPEETRTLACFSIVPVGICMLKVNNRNIRTRCEICLKLTVRTPERWNWHSSGAFIVNFEHISHFVLVLLLLTLNM